MRKYTVLISRVRTHAQNAKRREERTAQTVEKRSWRRHRDRVRHVVHLQHLCIFSFSATRLNRDIIHVYRLYFNRGYVVYRTRPRQRYSETRLLYIIYPHRGRFIEFVANRIFFNFHIRYILSPPTTPLWSIDRASCVSSPLLYVRVFVLKITTDRDSRHELCTTNAHVMHIIIQPVLRVEHWSSAFGNWFPDRFFFFYFGPRKNTNCTRRVRYSFFTVVISLISCPFIILISVSGRCV